MRSRSLLAALAAAVVLLLPGVAGALEWTARAGLEYLRQDGWNPAGARTTVPRLDVDLALDLRGAVGGPSLVTYGGGVQYRRTASTRDSIDDVRDQLSYRLRASLFNDPRSPASLRLHASRNEDDSERDGSALGSQLSSTYGGELVLSGGSERPFLRAGYTLNEYERENPVLGPSSRTIHSASGATAFGSSNFTTRVGYRANFSEGTYAFDNADDHRVNVEADVRLSPSARLRLREALFLRYPSTNSPFNPRLETNSFQATLNLLGTGSLAEGTRGSQVGTYRYLHGLNVTPGSPDMERAQHLLSWAAYRPLSDSSWILRGTASVSYAEDRQGPSTATAAGQSLGATVFWRDRHDRGHFELRGGGSVGALEPDSGDPIFGWGATAGASWNRTVPVPVSLSYDLTYQRDLDAVRGWSLRQQAVGQIDGRIAQGLWRGALQVSAESRNSRLLGAAASRSLIATLSYRRPRWESQLQAGLTDGLLGASGSDLSGDGLFLAPSFDSHTRYAVFSGSTRIWRYIWARGHSRYASSEVPDRPAFDEVDLLAAIELSYGALRIALEDRYLVTEATGGTARVNQVWVRVYRTLGSRY